MFKFITLLKRFIPPYKKFVFLSLSFNLLSTVFSLFSFAAIIPVLRILFKIEVVNKTYLVWTWSESMKEITAAIKNNLYYSIERLIDTVGPNLALLYVGLFLVIMTAFKVGASYFGSYFMIPIRTGV